MSKPTYQSCLRLKSGGTVRVTTLPDGEILFDIVDDSDAPVIATPNGAEANEMSSMLQAAARAAGRA